MSSAVNPVMTVRPSIQLHSGKTTMKRQLAIAVLTVSLASTPGFAGDVYYVPSPIAVSPAVTYYSAPVIYPAPVITTPVVYTTRTVAYQPAYVVPTSTIAVTTYPSSTVYVGHTAFAPMVPRVTTAYYAPTVAVGSGFVHTPYYSGHVPYGTREIEIKYKRRWHGGYKLDIDFD